MNNEIRVFSGTANIPLAKMICAYLGVPLGSVNIGRFPDGEISLKIEEDVRGRDVFIVQPTCPPVNEHLMELLIMIDSLRRASAQRITTVIPYYGYARQDRKDEGRVPITAKLVANLITEAGADRVLCMDLHAPQIQGFFDVPVDHLFALPAHHAYYAKMNLNPNDLAIVSPDEGRIKLALKFKDKLGGSLTVVDKRRASATETSPANLIGSPVEGKVAIMFDDMISTGGSIAGAAGILKKHGAREIHVCATHGLFSGNALERLREAPIDQIVVTDTVPISEEMENYGVRVITVSDIIGEAIRRIHYNESVSHLFNSRLF